ncbi:hypothetical protein [Variovorax sp. PAMC26660]|uniref:phage tail terminator protein n=1 Tax=Variovorax sp. PAMC26660 TaxID=2762322 RepID=UPI00164DABD1|nr:hypothetical protein [Variovorax sp. PAMC26660]QNK69193.1 hypothetical protein H7F35_05625 [Variovorax sp. PAMC26660]
MNVAPENDYLAVEAHLVARLKEKLAGMSPAVHVLTAADLADVAEANQPVPAVHVIYRNFRVLESRSDGRLAKLDHTWLAVTATRNVGGNRSGAAARRDASQLMAKVGAALMGFRAPLTSSPMRLTPGPGPGYKAGYQYLPLAFLVETHFHATTTP